VSAARDAAVDAQPPRLVFAQSPRPFAERGRAWATGGGGCVAALVAFLVLLFVLPAWALDFPALTGRVVDEANIFDPAARAALEQKLADLEAKTSDQVVVVTLKSLQGTSIEDYGYQLGRHWNIGQKGTNNGILLIVAPNERKVRIEVGYGLEGTVTDAISRLIIENGIVPRFRANDVPGGINRGVDDIVSVLTGDAEEWKQRAAKRPDTKSDPGGFGDILTMLLLFLAFWLIFRMMVGRMGSNQQNNRRGSPGVVVWGPGWGGGFGGGGFGGGGGGFGGGFSGGGGSFGGGGASGSW
jgi:uncharacterized protein